MEIYKLLYKEIEKEVLALAFNISFEEKHKTVYSLKIADLILRADCILESCLKESHIKNGANANVKYDDDIYIEKLNEPNMVVYAYNSQYHFDKKIFKPFIKTQERLSKSGFSNVGKPGDSNYSWNNAYQSLRHQFANAMPHYATLEYLFDTLAAIYVLINKRQQSKLFMTLTLTTNKQGEQIVGTWQEAAPYIFTEMTNMKPDIFK